MSYCYKSGLNKQWLQAIASAMATDVLRPCLGGPNQPYGERFYHLHIIGIISMDLSRRLGILVFTAVPAIVGGGIVMAVTGSLTIMWIYEALLLITAGALVSR